MLRDSIDNKEGLKTIELVERGVNHLNKLVVDVTQFSRQKALELHDVDLHELLSASVDLVSDRIHEKQIALKKIFNGHKIIGRWDVDQLRQVFVNIVANAIDASPQGGEITISTRLVRLDGDGNSGSADVTTYARTTVTDQGSGIDEASLQRIFEPFFSTKKRGTGLGLAIVRQIVEQHNGKISAESEPEKGTSFIIDLPL
jgi:two-component system NtrC family sensor kinase